jgi:arsenite/tail-anchored protein-transporting ATPase
MVLVLENKRLVFVGGKGGVGKSTSSSAIALHLSERLTQTGQKGKILLFSTDPAHSIGDSFNVKIGDTPTRITDTLDAVEIDADQLMGEFKNANQGAIRELLTKTANLDAKEADHALDLTIPGIDEFMSLVKLSEFIDNNTYRTICVDTAPTGHTLRLLGAPNVVNSWLMFFSGLHNKYKGIMKLMGAKTSDIDLFIKNLSSNIYRAHALITDKDKTEFIIVTIPDLMAIEETKRLVISLYSAGVKVNNIVINNIQSNLDCEFCRARRNHQNRYISMVDTMYPSINRIYMPLFAEDINGMGYLKAFENMLFS